MRASLRCACIQGLECRIRHHPLDRVAKLGWDPLVAFIIALLSVCFFLVACPVVSICLRSFGMWAYRVGQLDLGTSPARTITYRALIRRRRTSKPTSASEHRRSAVEKSNLENLGWIDHRQLRLVPKELLLLRQ